MKLQIQAGKLATMVMSYCALKVNVFILFYFSSFLFIVSSFFHPALLPSTSSFAARDKRNTVDIMNVQQSCLAQYLALVYLPIYIAHLPKSLLSPRPTTNVRIAIYTTS